MENKWKTWGLGEKAELKIAQVPNTTDIRGIVSNIQKNISEDDTRSTIKLALGDPSLIQSFRTSPVAEEALIQAIFDLPSLTAMLIALAFFQQGGYQTSHVLNLF